MEWTKKELDYLKESYGKIPTKELSRKLNRSSTAIYQQVRRSFKRSLIRKDFKGENNPNWKGGISKDNYHYKKLQVERYPNRVNARKLVFRAIEQSKLLKQPCEVCQSIIDIHAHHEDYNKPLEVIWLCRKHHREKHDNKH